MSITRRRRTMCKHAGKKTSGTCKMKYCRCKCKICRKSRKTRKMRRPPPRSTPKLVDPSATSPENVVLHY